jgi:hypothetical protein
VLKSRNLSIPLVVLGVLLQFLGYYTLARKIEPVMYQFYLVAWWSYIILIDGVLGLKDGRRSVLGRGLPWLVTASAAFWCLFELLNLRLQNWFYINVPPAPAVRFPGYFLAFGTVIPAVWLTNDLFLRILPEVKAGRLAPGRWQRYEVPMGLLWLALCLAFPTYLFGLVWGFLALVADGINYRRRSPSFTGDLEAGRLKPMLAAVLSGLACGCLWEFWNYWSITKWVYTVPFFERLKLFEMPVLGYVGFAAFGIETMACVNLIKGWVRPGRRRLVAALCALVVAFGTFYLIDRYTVFSYTSPVSELFFIKEGTREMLEARGVETSYGIDPDLLDSSERQQLALMNLRGLGLDNLQRLDEYGVRSIKWLAALDEKELSGILDEPDMRRVRIYLSAARAAAH